jgi:hypothetical protein
MELLVAGSGTERYATQNFQVACRPQGCEGFPVGCIGPSGAQAVCNRDEFIRISALIAISTHRGSYRVNGCSIVPIHDAGKVAKTVRRGAQGSPLTGLLPAR